MMRSRSGVTDEGEDMTSEEFHAALHNELHQPIEPPHTTQVGHATVKLPARDRGHRAWWTYATVNLAQHRIQVQVNLNLKRNDLSQGDYIKLSNLAFRGIKRRWSRSVSIGGQAFAVDVTALYGTGNAVNIDLAIEKGSDYSRSYNPRILGMDGTFFYNAGSFATPGDADDDFMEVAAHEFGHAVLTAVGGLGYSWKHKGSTSLFQNVKKSTPGYPGVGEIDLMRYYDGAKTPRASYANRAARTGADEWDVKCLLLVSKLAF
jgi:hypothetical protein